MRLGVLILTGLACSFGAMTDAVATVFGLIAWANADYWVARVIVGMAGITMTFVLAATKQIAGRDMPVIVKVVWALCLVLDIGTNVLSFTHFIVDGKTLSDSVALTPSAIWSIIEKHPDRGVLAAVLGAMVNFSTIATGYLVEATGEELMSPPAPHN